jgi:TonB family protein
MEWMRQSVLRSSGVAAKGLLCLSLGFLFAASAAAAREPGTTLPVRGGEPGQRNWKDFTGVLEAREGQTLKLTTDLGSVNIVTSERDGANTVRYRIRVETDARQPVAQKLLESYNVKARSSAYGVELTGTLPSQSVRAAAGNAQFSVQFEVVIPVSYNVEVRTEIGDIIAQEIGGTANLFTAGGNIFTQSIGTRLRGGSPRGVARVETQGGHIQVGDVEGDLTAFTAGGHIKTGSIHGDASLHSGGGHISVAGQISGRTDLETDGGNITVAQAGSFVNVRTGGGQIDFGEVRGSVRAQTGGGGIRVMTVSGPMQVESTSGSICLTKVSGTVQASTGDGTITAWINPDASSANGTVRLAGASQLASGNGDIVVFLPRNLAANIEAVVTSGDPHLIEFDPSLHLSVERGDSGSSGGGVHAWGSLNGGGAPLRLRTKSGKIRLRFLDADPTLWAALVRDQEERLRSEGVSFSAPAQVVPVRGPDTSQGNPVPMNDTKSDWLEAWLSKFEVAFYGGLREDPVEFRKRLTYCPPPSYPEIAQRAGVQGTVRLQVRVLKDGRVEVQKILEGEPSLVDAAAGAVNHWRANPILLNGERVEVISVVTFNFQLH